MPKLLASALVVSLTATGCIAGSKRPGYVVAGVSAAIGVGLLASTAATDCSSRPAFDALTCGAGDLGRAQIGVLALAAGAGLLLATAIIPTPGAEPIEVAPLVVAEAPPAPPPVDLGDVDVPNSDAHVSMLHNFTLQARTAARLGHCAAVEAIAQRVGELDPTYRHHGFAFDPLVAACLRY